AALAFTGMRRSNCRHLRVEDVDLNGGWIYVRSREGAETKRGTEWKTPIHPRLAAILHSLPMPQEGYVFTSPPSRKHPLGGRWIDARRLNDEFVETLKKLELPAGRGDGFTLHSLRHFFKSFCISNGVPREYVDAWQGHMGIRSAADLYAHTLDSKSLYWMSRVRFGGDM